MKYQKLIFVFVLFFSLIFRLYLAPSTFHQDLLSQADWGQYIYNNSPKNFYQYNVWTFSWPNHPPLTSLWYGFAYHIFRESSLALHRSSLFLINHTPKFYFFTPFHQFVDSYDRLVSPEKPFPLGFLLCLKLLPILADILIAIIIFNIASKKTKWPIIFPTIYLTSPFSWYISSLWGQTDPLAYLFTLLSFLSISATIPSIILFYIGAAIKPTSLVLAPLFLFLIIKTKSKLIPVILGILICLCLTQVTFKAFSPHNNTYQFTINTLLPRLSDRPSRLTTNSYNFWHLITLDRGLSAKTKLMGFSGNFWGILIYIILNIFSFSLLKKINQKTIFSAFFIVSFGSWLFLTNMLDRYSFAGIITGLILTIYYPKTFFYWLTLSLVYWLNLFRGWWYPVSFEFLKDIMVYKNHIFGYIPSLLNTTIFFIFTQKISQKH